MKKGNNQYASYLFMAGVVAMVAIVAASVFNNGSNLDGAVSATERASEYQRFCSDDDVDDYGRDDFFKKGTVHLGNRLYADSCTGDWLLQHYCNTGRNVKTRRAYPCPNGCLNGACLRK